MDYFYRYRGGISMLSYVLMVALSSMLIHQKERQITPMLSAFYTIFCCLVIYGIFSTSLFSKLNKIHIYWFEVLMLNITTAICWIFTFFSLKFIAPDLYLFTYIIAMPIASYFIFRVHLFKAFIYMAGLILLASTYQHDGLLIGFFLALMGGASGAVYSIFAKKVTSDFSTLEILSLRFYLTVIITFIASFYFGSFRLMSFDFYLGFFGLSMVSIVIPLALFQVGIKNLSITKAFSYLPLAPLICYAIQFFNATNVYNPLQLAAVLLLSLAIVWRGK